MDGLTFSLQVVSYEAFLTQFYINLECTQRSISLVQQSASKNGSPTVPSTRLTGRAGGSAVSWQHTGDPFGEACEAGYLRFPLAPRRYHWRWSKGHTLGKWLPSVSMNLKLRTRWSGTQTIVPKHIMHILLHGYYEPSLFYVYEISYLAFKSSWSQECLFKGIRRSNLNFLRARPNGTEEWYCYVPNLTVRSPLEHRCGQCSAVIDVHDDSLDALRPA